MSHTPNKYASDLPHKVVVKVGSALLDSAETQFNRGVINDLADDLTGLMKRGTDAVLVSSGAVGAGLRNLNWEGGAKSIIDRQALAALGQPLLMRYYNQVFGERGVKVAQILLTRLGLEDRQRYLNARHTIDRLLDLGILPIVNENDTVVTEELQFGDNDRLAAVVAGKIHSDLLILLTDVESVWDAEKRPVRRVTEITPALLGAAGGPGTVRSRGGMKSKLRAVQEAMLMGVSSVITSGRIPHIVRRVVEAFPRMADLSQEPDPSVPGTWFISSETVLLGKKRWLLSCQSMRGKIRVDAGAQRALESGDRSLLPSGILSVSGTFDPGDPVAICSADEELIAQGLANLSSEELNRFKGKSTREIREKIGREVRKTCVAVHHDDMVLFSQLNQTVPRREE